MNINEDTIYERTFIDQIDDLNDGALLSITGMIIYIKRKEKYIIIKLDDSTSIIDCILIGNPKEANEIRIGDSVNILAEKETKILKEGRFSQVKIRKLIILYDINEEFFEYFKTYEKLQITIEEEQEAEPIKQFFENSANQGKNLASLSKNALILKLRSATLFFIQKKIEFSQDLTNISQAEIKNSSELQEIFKNEANSASLFEISLKNCVQKGFLVVSSTDFANNLNFNINLEIWKRIYDFIILKLIEWNQNGCEFNNIYKYFNDFIDLNDNFVSKDFVWDFLNVLHKKNLIYRSNEKRFHSISLN